MEVSLELARSSNVELPFIDDIQIPFEKKPEGIMYDPYKILPPFECGNRFDRYG